MQRENVSDHLKKGKRYRVHFTTTLEGRFEGVGEEHGRPVAIFRSAEHIGRVLTRRIPLDAIRHEPELLDAAKPERLDAVVPK